MIDLAGKQRDIKTPALFRRKRRGMEPLKKVSNEKIKPGKPKTCIVRN